MHNFDKKITLPTYKIIYLHLLGWLNAKTFAVMKNIFTRVCLLIRGLNILYLMDLGYVA